MASDPVRRIHKLALRLEMPPGLPKKARAVLERAAHTCPVKQSLHPDVAVEVVFAWPD
jgi:putative redox protein